MLTSLLPPIPKPISKDKCTGITFWTKDNYQKFLKTKNQHAGATEGDLSSSQKKEC